MTASQRQCLLVGSGGGIGTAIVSRLDSAGYRLIGIDEHPAPPVTPLTFVAVADLGTGDNLDDCCGAIEARVNALWAIIYNAGTYPMVALEDYNCELWDRTLAVNVRSAFIIFRRLQHLLVAGGRIVTIVSGAANVGSRDVGYSTSKAGLLGLTRSLAINLSHRQIQVNAVLPGVIDTAMSARMTVSRRQEHENRSLLRRSGKPHEVAVAVEFLLNPANSFMTGGAIDVNGGLYLR